jgi:hypothetical protein
MVQYIPASQLRASGSELVADFSSRLDDALWLSDLVVLFSQSASLLGAVGHSCLAVGGGVERFLFGEPPERGGVEREALRFPITAWDQLPYVVEIGLLPGLGALNRGSLHAMSVLYLNRGLALLEAGDEVAPAQLTPIERFCLDQSRQGHCDLDIGEDIGLSAHAVRVHLRRAGGKLADCAMLP